MTLLINDKAHVEGLTLIGVSSPDLVHDRIGRRLGKRDSFNNFCRSTSGRRSALKSEKKQKIQHDRPLLNYRSFYSPRLSLMRVTGHTANVFGVTISIIEV